MINKIITLGKINRLRIDRLTNQGFYLVPDTTDDEERNDSILLPNQYITKDMKLDDEIEVFVYTDSEDRPVATTETPKAMLGEFAYLEVVSFRSFGAFLDWGLQKDLLLPKNRQRKQADVGDKKVVMVDKDQLSERLIAIEKFNKYLEKDTSGLKRKQEVEIIVYAESPIGYQVVVDNKYDGLVFKNEIFETINIGDKKKATIKNIRDDGKLDISLQKIGKARLDDSADKVLEYLKKHKSMTITSKSTPEEIYDTFGLSKKAFKASLTSLKEKALITQDDEGIKLC